MTETASDRAPADAHPGYRGATDQILRHNDDVAWEVFESDAYWEHNYRSLRKDDQAIIHAVGEFFSRHFENAPKSESLRGLDVGSGANLYPALGQLPWSGSVTLTDLSPANVAWLRRAAAGIATDLEDELGSWVWQPFWDEYAQYPAYRRLEDPRRKLAERHDVQQLSVMDLPATSWDLGTMFFVAESMTSYENEFEHATESFTNALVPGAPFGAAFMDSSVGYVVADQSFPAVQAVNASLVQEVLSRFSADVVVREVDVPANDPLRDGYEGMIVAVGTTLVT